MCGFDGINACFLIFLSWSAFSWSSFSALALTISYFFGLNGFFEIFGLLGQEALGVDLVKLFDERLSFCWESVRLFVCGGLGLQVVRESVGVSHG
ncbi:hypothetical protein CIP107521_02068 [Corynebacterium diphtheriae]|nr:hypothetical protein CIP107521_02068 [Corynebacterium diphtheriae]